MSTPLMSISRREEPELRDMYLPHRPPAVAVVVPCERVPLRSDDPEFATLDPTTESKEKKMAASERDGQRATLRLESSTGAEKEGKRTRRAVSKRNE
jgi:hypothetical protein